MGKGRWLPRGGLGTFAVGFPSAEEPGDDGWHIEVSFAYEKPDFMEWRANCRKGRALLMLFLFSDVGIHDSTRIRVGSHIDTARQLAPAKEAGRPFGVGLGRMPDRPIAGATGNGSGRQGGVPPASTFCIRITASSRASLRSRHCYRVSRSVSSVPTIATRRSEDYSEGFGQVTRSEFDAKACLPA